MAKWQLNVRAHRFKVSETITHFPLIEEDCSQQQIQSNKHYRRGYSVKCIILHQYFGSQAHPLPGMCIRFAVFMDRNTEEREMI